MGTSWEHIIFVNMGLKKPNIFEKMYVEGTMRLGFCMILVYFCENNYIFRK